MRNEFDKALFDKLLEIKGSPDWSNIYWVSGDGDNDLCFDCCEKEVARLNQEAPHNPSNIREYSRDGGWDDERDHEPHCAVCDGTLNYYPSISYSLEFTKGVLDGSIKLINPVTPECAHLCYEIIRMFDTEIRNSGKPDDLDDPDKSELPTRPTMISMRSMFAVHVDRHIRQEPAIKPQGKRARL